MGPMRDQKNASIQNIPLQGVARGYLQVGERVYQIMRY